jgi:hypothetical protein
MRQALISTYQIPGFRYFILVGYQSLAARLQNVTLVSGVLRSPATNMATGQSQGENADYKKDICLVAVFVVVPESTST